MALAGSVKLGGSPLSSPRPSRSSVRCRAADQSATAKSKDLATAKSKKDKSTSVPDVISSVQANATPAPTSMSAAMAAKLSAARTLARRLTEERLAGGNGSNKAAAIEASVLAAAEAAKADTLARASKKQEASQNEQLAKLKAENDVLKELLMELASMKELGAGKVLQKSKLEEMLAESISKGAPIPVSSIFAPAAKEKDFMSAAPSTVATPPPLPSPSPPLSPPPAPAPDQDVAPTLSMLKAAAASSLTTGFFTFPPMPVHIPGPVVIYYNRRRKGGPLASGGGGGGGRKYPLLMKLGTNKWETIDALDMAPANMDLPDTEGEEWWFVRLELPYEVFQVDFVIQDLPPPQSNIAPTYDNNAQRDFKIQLKDGPTEQQIIQNRLQALRKQDAERILLLQEECERLKSQVEIEAAEVANLARAKARAHCQSLHVEAARKVLKERRSPELDKLPATETLRGVYSWPMGPPVAGKRTFLAYNLTQAPFKLQESVMISSTPAKPTGLLVHVGYDGWWNKASKVFNLAPLTLTEIDDMIKPQVTSSSLISSAPTATEEWWGAWIDIPLSAYVLDFVLSNKERDAWDNNQGKDFHTLVSDGFNEDQLLEALTSSIASDNEIKDKDKEERAASRAYKKIRAKGEAIRRRKEALHEILFTVPAVPVPGSRVEVYYNPELTPLRGRPDIFVKGSCNRWRGRNGVYQRQEAAYCAKMTPSKETGGLGYHKAVIDVPSDAWGMDLVFADNDSRAHGGGGGFVDDNGGLDYHIPVQTHDEEGTATAAGGGGGGLTQGGELSSSSSMRKRSQSPSRTRSTIQCLKIVHIAVEMAPIAKVGGMGDVVTALGRAVQDEGHQVECILPKYDCINYSQVQGLVQEASFPFGGTQVKVWKGLVEELPTIFLEPENGHFWVGCIYGKNNDAQRFGFFCGAALEFLKRRGEAMRPDVIHCHDWPTAPIAWGDRAGSRCIFTIHNLSYGADLVGRAMATCEVATTVSPTYAREISGHGSVAPNLKKLYGIRNGIDPELWDPEDDPHLPLPYSSETALQGKEAARRALRQRLNLSDIDVPIVSCVTRLVAQKGIHLIKHAAWRTLERGGQFILLGSAPDPKVQGEFNALRDQLTRQYNDRAAMIFSYDEPLSHLIYAGSDLFLVPSMFEPCGLTQMIAMNFGSIPVVRKTGGLADTVFDVDNGQEIAQSRGMMANGFVFESTDTAGLDHALNRALSTFHSDKRGFREIQAKIMKQDWSWFSPALDYVELYFKAMRG